MNFGHSLACRSVGGRADQIVLWPLGGVAFVDPPPRPGATLWSIAAGPLVNVLLIPIFSLTWFFAKALNWPETNPNLYNLITTICFINAALLAFNMLPIYPLDGGQILRSLLWFFLGRARSLMVASGIGLVAVVLLMIFAIRDVWLTIMAAFALLNCWGGLQQARILARVTAAPRRAGLACPKCKTPPPVGNFWVLRQVPRHLRHVCHARRLPQLRHHLQRHPLPGMRRAAAPFRLRRNEFLT